MRFSSVFYKNRLRIFEAQAADTDRPYGAKMGIRRGTCWRSEENPILLAAILYDLQQPFANFHYHLMSISQFSTIVGISAKNLIC